MAANTPGLNGLVLAQTKERLKQQSWECHPVISLFVEFQQGQEFTVGYLRSRVGEPPLKYQHSQLQERMTAAQHRTRLVQKQLLWKCH